MRLLRRGKTKAQKKLDAEQREKNLAGNIHMLRTSLIPDRAILVDDVYTTGATASACAYVLKQGGVRRVDALTVMMDL